MQAGTRARRGRQREKGRKTCPSDVLCPPAEVTQCCLVHCRFPRVQHITVLRYVDRERDREGEGQRQTERWRNKEVNRD